VREKEKKRGEREEVGEPKIDPNCKTREKKRPIFFPQAPPASIVPNKAPIAIITAVPLLRQSRPFPLRGDGAIGSKKMLDVTSLNVASTLVFGFFSFFLSPPSIPTRTKRCAEIGFGRWKRGRETGETGVSLQSSCLVVAVVVMVVDGRGREAVDWRRLR